MNRFWWRVALVLSELLSLRERTAVCGDLVEVGARGGQATREITGLVLRRQAELWLGWRPWFALLSIAIPAGILLSHISRVWADDAALHSYWYVEHWDAAFLNSPGSRANLAAIAAMQMLHALALLSWSWTAGYALGVASARTSGASVALFALIVGLGTVGTSTVGRSHNDTILTSHVYGLVFPRLVRLACVVMPATIGLWQARRHRASPRRMVLTVALAAIVLTVCAAPSLEASLTFGRGRILSHAAGPDATLGTHDDERPLWPVSLVMLWPAAFIAARTQCPTSARTR